MAAPAHMTSRQRIDAVFAGQPTDRVPVCHIGLCSESASHVLGREAYVGGGIQQWREVKSLWEGPDSHAEFVERSYQDAVAVSMALGNDFIRPTYWRCNRKPHRKINGNTYILGDGPEESWQVLTYDPLTEQAAITPYKPRPTDDLTLAGIEEGIRRQEERLPDHSPTRVADEFARRAMAEHGNEYAIRVGGVGLGIPHNQTWMEALALRPELVERHTTVSAAYSARNVQVLVAEGFHYLFGGYDFASNTGPMFSPALFNRLMVPGLRQITDACDQAGAKHLFASDGHLWPVAQGLFGVAGIHGYYEIDASAGMDLRRLRDAFPDLVLLGNIQSQTVHLGTREDVINETRSCMEAALDLGRIIVGVSNYLVPGTPPGNIEAMLTTIEDMRG
ncbi:MAG: hypothetical protein HN742_05025 [Lentisphaerae bacterium]|jgi:hypothetical protein|nr:hypothetical protein [Lentisphaerota bacterium]MBT4819824.1 hypothetical protein [Lentisphaerota bacterium]MBT5610820.1 hypothetical protein [Lentisphaerota bacterium]MBT7053748.1 hypothetical protein [Lentisphaerota bacterium]MBT7841209.1 hypothetical protein [Lentisphaerota bacterium]